MCRGRKENRELSRGNLHGRAIGVKSPLINMYARCSALFFSRAYIYTRSYTSAGGGAFNEDGLHELDLRCKHEIRAFYACIYYILFEKRVIRARELRIRSL